MAQAGSGSNSLVFSSSRGGIIIRSTEDYDSEIHVLISLMTLLLMYDLVEAQADRQSKPTTEHVNRHCDWFIFGFCFQL